MSARKSFTDLYINRPILAIVVSMVIVIIWLVIGIVSLERAGLRIRRKVGRCLGSGGIVHGLDLVGD